MALVHTASEIHVVAPSKASDISDLLCRIAPGFKQGEGFIRSKHLIYMLLIVIAIVWRSTWEQDKRGQMGKKLKTNTDEGGKDALF